MSEEKKFNIFEDEVNEEDFKKIGETQHFVIEPDEQQHMNGRCCE